MAERVIADDEVGCPGVALCCPTGRDPLTTLPSSSRTPSVLITIRHGPISPPNL